MRRVLVLLCAIGSVLFCARTVAQEADDGKSSDAAPLRRSDLPLGSYPKGPEVKAPLSTGYYVSDSDAPGIGPPWAPAYTLASMSGPELRHWRRILSGPKQRDPSYWTQPESFGYEYFRNPDNVNDSTDDAFAGPIAIGFPFYYYGRKYDSFYVWSDRSEQSSLSVR
jgi:hypothetical protein